MYIESKFLRKNEPSMLFVPAGATDTKVLHSTGVATTNPTNKYQKCKSVELGDQLIYEDLY